jgi:cytochrome c oxidase cbb3-type subunit 3
VSTTLAATLADLRTPLELGLAGCSAGAIPVRSAPFRLLATARACSLVCALLCTGSVLTGAAPGLTASSPRQDPDTLIRGRVLFDAQCARCHGVGGFGGQGPSLRRPRLRRAPDDVALRGLIRNGVPGTGMPETWQLSDREVGYLIAYVRSLGRLPPVHLPGDSARGRELFVSKGSCTSCHIVGGAGGTRGPDLTEIGALRNPAYLREALLDPAATQPTATAANYPWGEYARYLIVRVVSRAGEEVVGQRVNEDAFTIQIRDVRGGFHSFEKADLRVLERRARSSLMPAFGATLTPAELDDVVAYLAGLRGAP